MPLLTRSTMVACYHSALTRRPIHAPNTDDDDDLMKGQLDLNDALLLANNVGGHVNPDANDLVHEDEPIMEVIELNMPVSEEGFDSFFNNKKWGILRVDVVHTDPRDSDGDGYHFVAVKRVTIAENEFKWLMLGGEEHAVYIIVDDPTFRWLFGGEGREELIGALSTPFGGIDAATIT